MNAVKKLQLPVAAAKALLSSYGRFNVVQVSPELILGAVDLHAATQLSFWDALVVRAPSASGLGRPADRSPDLPSQHFDRLHLRCP